MVSVQFSRLVRFISTSDPTKVLIGQPEQDDIDVGFALRQNHEVKVHVFSGSSILDPGQKTGNTATVRRLLSPLASSEVGTIRCIGLNYKNHAAEVGLDLPTLPTVFLKPSTSIGDPWPSATPLPRLTQADDCGDYEAELVVVIGKSAKNVTKEEAMDYVLGYTAANDVSSRTSQFAQSQWCFSKGFDGSCPLGPALVSKELVPDPSKFHIRGLKGTQVLQDSGVDDLIFDIPTLVSFLSQGTTLPPGTIILTGTPAGVGIGRKPKVTISDGDEFSVEVLPHIGTLFNTFKNE
ncbi:related to bifunctional 4-hydroxyphenylacetate degradation enzyme [Fusarium torulosum]|uniref:Related to bifunctional 4-hydroxyphenylacetate degradation enzyme n=1 Tax=Fusarium torulosum TaxID=33205 RepID=A0AAE8MMB2_9HYPO|nr:related to bifunctional 4-hydroxyphenylacetate degradation enzyme [Fusarium torulosum]